jgi:uncharacterized protein (DUF433 family)
MLFLSDFDYISEAQIQAVLDFAKRNFTSQ